jgi:hypothetical protein
MDLIDLFEKRMPVYEAAGDERPLWMRHAQGDQWDLLLMFPIESFSKYYAPERVERRKKAATESGLSREEFNRLYYEYSAYHEDLIVEGAPLPDIRKAYDDAGYFHTEMFVALPGKREELYKEREMENTYLAAVGRPVNFTLVAVEGAAWDIVSLGFYRDLAHFAGSRDVPAERQEAAAKAAGFKGADHIGPYMRTLILFHRDTHGGTLK